MTNANIKLEVSRTSRNGKPAVEIVVINATKCPELDALTIKLGYEPIPMIANHRHVVCTTPAELDAVRNPIAKFFAADGSFVG